MIRSLAYGLVAALLAVPAVAGVQPQAAPQNRNTEIICKTVATSPGSRIGVRKVCLTRAEWEQRAQRDRDALVRTQDNGLLSNQP